MEEGLIVRTDTLHKAKGLLRQNFGGDELAVSAVPYKLDSGPGVVKWVDAVLTNAAKEPISDLVAIQAFGRHLYGGWVPYKGLGKLLAERLEPLDSVVGTLELWLDFMAVRLKLEFCVGGLKRSLTVSLGQFPDSDDWDSHGVYNLLKEERIPSTRDEVAAVRLRQLIELASRDPILMHAASPSRFEELIAALFEHHGFRQTWIGKTGDGGVDIIAIQDSTLSPTLHLIQCKRYKNKVSIASVRELFGVKADRGANKAVLVTTSSFTKSAREFAERNCWEIQLIDFADLGRLLEAATSGPA
jgi:hypothetical protein